MSPFPDSRGSKIKPRLKQRIFGLSEDSRWYKRRRTLQIQWAELSDEPLPGEQATGSNAV